MPITEWRLDGHIRAADGAGTPFTIIVEALWVRVQLGEPMRVRPLMLLGVGIVILGIQFVLMGLLGEMIAHLGAHRVYPERRRYNLGDGA